MELKRLENDKKKNVLQTPMESENVEFQSDMGTKRKKVSSHHVKPVVSDTDEAVEGPKAVVTDNVGAGPLDSADSENFTSLPRLRDVTVHSETVYECRNPKGQPSDGIGLKESCGNKLNSLEKEASTCSERMQDGILSKGGVKCMHPEAIETALSPESVGDSCHAILKSVSSKRKRVCSESTEKDLCSCGGAVNKDLGRLCTCKMRAQYSNKSPHYPSIDNSDVGNYQRKVVNENVDQEAVQVASSERGPPRIATCNQFQSLQNDGVIPASNLHSKQTFIVEQKCLYNSLLEESMKLCNILKLHEDVTHTARRFLEYVTMNHRLSTDSPAILQAFQVSLCWIAASISKQTVDKKASLMLVRKHLNYQCEKHIQSVYKRMRTLKRKYLAEQDIDGEALNERDSESVSDKLQDVRMEIGVKSPNEVRDGSETDKKILEIGKQCRKRKKELQRKQLEEILEFHIIWDEKREQLDKDLKFRTASIRSVFSKSEVSVRTEELKRLNDEFARNIDEHNLLRDLELKNLEAEQLATMNEEKRKVEHWLTAIKVYNAEPVSLNVPSLIDANAGVSQLGNTTVHATRFFSGSTEQVVDKNASESESTRNCQDQNLNDNSPRHLDDQIPSKSVSTPHSEDQIPTESVCVDKNTSAPANTSISTRPCPVHCDIPIDMRNLVTGDFQNEVVEKDIGRSSVDVVEQSNQLKHLFDNAEVVCTKLPASKDQLVNLAMESLVEVPANALNVNVSQDEICSSVAESINQNELAVQNQHDSQVGVSELERVDIVIDVLSNCELEEGEIQEVELEEGEIREEGPTLKTQGIVNSETITIVDPEEEEPIAEKHRNVHSETAGIVEPVRIAEQQEGIAPDLGNQHTSKIQVKRVQPVNDSSTDDQSNVDLQDLVTCATEIESTSEVASSGLMDNADPAEPSREQPRADSPTINNQKAYVTQVPFSYQSADVVEAEVLSQPVSQMDPVQQTTEQPRAEAETFGSQKTCFIEAPITIHIADVAEIEARPHESDLQIDTVHPIMEQDDVETVRSQNTSHIEAPVLSQIADLAEAETEALPLKPPSQICLVEHQNTYLTEVPFSSQIAEVAETEVCLYKPVTQIEPVQPTEQLQADDNAAENQNPSLIEVSLSQIANVAATEVPSVVPVSQGAGNLAMMSVSHEQIVELTTSFEINEPICESVIGEAELLIEGVPQYVTSARYLITHYFDPIESELEKTIKENEEHDRHHAKIAAELTSNCEKEMEEMRNQIKQKYGMHHQVDEAEFLQRNGEIEKYINKLQNNKELAEGFRNKLADIKLIGQPVNQQGTVRSIHMQQYPSSRIITSAGNFQPSPSHSNAGFVETPSMPHQSIAHPMRFSQVTSNSATVPYAHYVTVPPVHSCSHPNTSSVRPQTMPHHYSFTRPMTSSPITSHSATTPSYSVHNMEAISTPLRPPPVIRFVMPSHSLPYHSLHDSREGSSVAPHLQSLRPCARPTTSSISRYPPTFQGSNNVQDNGSVLTDVVCLSDDEE